VAANFAGKICIAIHDVAACMRKIRHEVDGRSMRSRSSTIWHNALTLWPGCALAAVVALAATAVSTLHGGPQLLYALLFGVALHFLSNEPSTKPGIEFCSRDLLRLGVGLLGARITVDQIAGLGWQTALIVVAAVTATMLCGLVVGRRLGLTLPQRVLSGGAVAICGASAALAISSVLPREKGGERFTLMVVVAVTILSTLSMVIYPLIARLLHLPPALAGIFIGGTIHDVAQVVGAGYTLGQEAGDVATIVKLFRVSLLAVVVVIVALAFRTSRERANASGEAVTRAPDQALIPWFLWLFVGMVILNSTHVLPPFVQVGLNDVSRGCLVTAIAALGMKTSVQHLAETGWRPMALIVIETLWIAGFVLAFIVMRR
jgi:uncharacterized integral membrane protein (TIGR00698 family)